MPNCGLFLLKKKVSKENESLLSKQISLSAYQDSEFAESLMVSFAEYLLTSEQNWSKCLDENAVFPVVAHVSVTLN